MSKKQNPGFELPDLPDMSVSLPDLPDMNDLPDVDHILEAALAEPLANPLDKYDAPEDASMEEMGQLVDKAIDDEFAAIRAGREQQRQAIDLANDSEYWFAVYFQTRDQKEAFLHAMKWFQHGDKYIDGQWAAKKQGIELPPRPAPYKVGRLDKKLTDLT